MAIRLGVVAGGAFDPVTGRGVPTVWNLRTGSVTRWPDVQRGVLPVNRWGTLGTGGAIVHADGRVVSVGSGMVNVVTDQGAAAGATQPFGGQAVRWLGC